MRRLRLHLSTSPVLLSWDDIKLNHSSAAHSSPAPPHHLHRPGKTLNSSNIARPIRSIAPTVSSSWEDVKLIHSCVTFVFAYAVSSIFVLGRH